MTIDVLPNFVGLGVGVTSEYAGSDHYVGGAVPGFRYQFPDSNRTVELYGPALNINLLDSPNWQFGPAAGFRLGRQDVSDATIASIHDIDSTVEGGLALSYTYQHQGRVPWRLRTGAVWLTDLGDTYSGSNVQLYSNIWVPLSPKLFLGLGGGVSFSSASFNRTYFGVNTQDAAASGLPAYAPGGGLRQFYAWPALLYQFDKNWVLGTGVFYQHYTGAVSGSPVTRHGSNDQFTAGVGIGYTWR